MTSLSDGRMGFERGVRILDRVGRLVHRSPDEHVSEMAIRLYKGHKRAIFQLARRLNIEHAVVHEPTRAVASKARELGATVTAVKGHNT